MTRVHCLILGQGEGTGEGREQGRIGTEHGEDGILGKGAKRALPWGEKELVETYKSFTLPQPH